MGAIVNKVNNISLRYPQGFKMERVHPLVKALFPIYSVPVGPLAGRLSLFYSNWTKLTQDPNILNIIQGFEIPFLEKPYQTKLPNRPVLNHEPCQGGGSQGNVVKRGNTESNTVQKSVHKQSLSDIKKGWGKSHGNKFETSEQFHPLPTFQNGGAQFASKHATGKGFHVQIRPKRRLLLCATKKGKQEICAFPVGRDTLRVPVSLFRARSSTTDIYKNSKNTHFITKKATDQGNNLFRRHAIDVTNKRGVVNQQGHCDISADTSRFCKPQGKVLHMSL